MLQWSQIGKCAGCANRRFGVRYVLVIPSSVTGDLVS
jgi:hypothetical protein